MSECRVLLSASDSRDTASRVTDSIPSRRAAEPDAGGCEREALPSPIGMIALPHHHPGLLETVDDPNHLAPVDLDGIGDLLLRAARVLVHAGEHLVCSQGETSGGQLPLQPSGERLLQLTQGVDRTREQPRPRPTWRVILPLTSCSEASMPSP